MIKKQIVIVSLLVILLSFTVIAEGDLKITAPSVVEANKDFNVDITLNSNGANVKSITLYVTSELGKVTFKSSSRTGTVWLSTVAPTNDQVAILDGKSVYNFKVGPAGSLKESSSIDKKVVTLIASASENDKIVVYKLNDAQGTTATKYPTGSLILNPVSPTVFTVTAPTPAPDIICGNNVRDTGEECDGTSVTGGVCPSGKTGTVKCTSGCKYDYSGCSVIAPQTTENTIGAKIDAGLTDNEKKSTSWSAALLSKIANILKFSWFTN